MALPALGQLFKFARDTQDIYKLHETVKDLIAALDARVRAVEDRVLRMEAEQGQIVSEAFSPNTRSRTPFDDPSATCEDQRSPRAPPS